MQKSFFANFFSLVFRKAVWLGVLFMVLWSAPSQSAQKLNYRSYDSRTGEVINRFTHMVEKLSAGGYMLESIMEKRDTQIREKSFLNDQYETLRWTYTDNENKTNYSGKRQGDRLVLKGNWKGAVLDKEIILDERPFYFNPKLGLVGFVRSSKRKQKFWGFHHDRLEAYPMKVVKKGIESIFVNGKRVNAVKVHWTVDDWRSIFFKRTYWFRRSDGLYLKQKVDGKVFRELVSEGEE